MAKKSTTKSARSATTRTIRKTTKKSTTRLTKAITKSGSKANRPVKTEKKPAKTAPLKTARATPVNVNGHHGDAHHVDPKTVKSHLSKKELNQYRTLLLVKRAEILGDMSSMSREALQDSANLSHMPIHMADVGSDNYEQELMLGLVESERKLVQEINSALDRITEGTYGICQGSGKPINKERLAAKPWAKYCIEIAREMERSGRGGY